MNAEPVITFEPIFACSTSWRIRANGREVACASVRTMGPTGLYYYRDTGLVSKDDASRMFREHFAGEGACKFRTQTGRCEFRGSTNWEQVCVPCECYRPRVEAVKEINGVGVLPQKKTEEAK